MHRVVSRAGTHRGRKHEPVELGVLEGVSTNVVKPIGQRQRAGDAGILERFLGDAFEVHAEFHLGEV